MKLFLNEKSSRSKITKKLNSFLKSDADVSEIERVCFDFISTLNENSHKGISVNLSKKITTPSGKKIIIIAQDSRGQSLIEKIRSF